MMKVNYEEAMHWLDQRLQEALSRDNNMRNS